MEQRTRRCRKDEWKQTVRGFFFAVEKREGGGSFSSGMNKHEGAGRKSWLSSTSRWRLRPTPHQPLNTHLLFFYLLSLPLQCSFDFSIFCNLKVSKPDVKLRLQLTSDTGQAAKSIKSSNWVPVAAVYWQNKSWELGARGPVVLRPVHGCSLPIYHWLSPAHTLVWKMFHLEKHSCPTWASAWMMASDDTY